MLFYLDNWLSVGPNSAEGSGHSRRIHGTYSRTSAAARPAQAQTSGLNENYGRELLELHTLSVNGGYSQRDVTEVAKVFTGWTIEKPNEGRRLQLRPAHARARAQIRARPSHQAQRRKRGHGSAAHAGHSPQTAHFISLKLARAFCLRRSAAGAGRSHGENFLKKEGRHSRSAEHAVPFARILGRQHVSRQSENAAGIRGLGGARHRRRR